MASEFYNDSFSELINKSTSPQKYNSSFNCDLLVDFDRLRISALSKAAEISSEVKEVTIGPSSPMKKTIDNKENTNIISEQYSNQTKKSDHILNKDLQYTAAMKLYEATLYENSEFIFKNLIEKMISNREKIMKQYRDKQSKDVERRNIEFKARKQKILNEMLENDNVMVLEKVKQEEQQNYYINTKTIEEMNKILEEQNKAAARFASVTDSHTKICICYNEINKIFEENDYAKSLADKFIEPINTVITNINKIMDSCRNGNITDKDVEHAESLATNFGNVLKNILEEAVKLQQHDERKKLEEIEAAAVKEQNDLKEVESALTKNEPVKPQPVPYYSAANYKHYMDLKNNLLKFESLYKDLLDNTTLKKYKFECQKAVNTPVNSISSVSGDHLRDKFDKLLKLLNGEKVQVLDTFISANQHPQGLFYCTALLAKKIVRQGDSLVSSNPEAAFPLASIAVSLWAKFPDFGKLLEAYFHRECPYLVPMFLPLKEGMTNKEYYLSRGYTYSEDGVVERQDKFLKRMSGIFRLMCAIWIAKTPKFINSQNPHGLTYGWRWLASFINIKPEPDICATLLHDFFIICGHEFFKHYGVQFRKIVKLISTEYMEILNNIDEGGPKTRLEVLLRTLSSGHIDPPNGMLPLNFW